MKLITTTLITIFTILQSFAQDISIVTTGQGKTIEEAKLNALRTGIEQAFGVFISSSTEIINDELKNDEIVTITNGNIKEFQIIEERSDNQEHFVIIKSIVSLSTLTEYLRGKGHNEVSFDGSNFVFNIKLQKFNEESELSALKNVLTSFLIQAQSAFKKELTISEPQSWYGEFKVGINVDFKASSNLQEYYSRLIESLKSISMSEDEVRSYKDLGKEVYKLIPVHKQNEKYSYLGNYAAEPAIYFRNPNSEFLISSFLFCANLNLIYSVNVKSEITELSITRSVDLQKPVNYEIERGEFTVNKEPSDFTNYWNHWGSLPFRFGRYNEYDKIFDEHDLGIWNVLAFKDYYSRWTNDIPVKDFIKTHISQNTRQQLESVAEILKELNNYSLNSIVINAPLENQKFKLWIYIVLSLEQMSKISKFTLH